MNVTQQQTERNSHLKLRALAPEVITSLGLLIGFYSLVFAINGRYGLAALMIAIAMVFDWLDGFVARILQTSSRLGVEFDSLSDVTTFGVAPAVLTYVWALKPAGLWSATICGPYILCSALRLARFNIQVDSVDKSRFVGLPVPGAAAMIAGVALIYGRFEIDWPRALCAIMVPLTLILAYLMVSRVPYPSSKSMSLRHTTLPMTIAMLIAIGFLLSTPRIAVCVFASIYLASGPILFARGERIDADVPGLWPGSGKQVHHTVNAEPAP
jgi:CDP-diacylglycerol--serine O-phosphatidyltransferase